MTDSQEWQQSNAQRAFPFTEQSRSVDAASALPYDFIVDLKVFPYSAEDNGMYLYSVSYDTSTSSYSLVFRYSHSEQVAISGTVTRTDGAQSRVGTKVLLENAPNDSTAYCLLTPGPKWEYGAPSGLWIMTDPGSVHSGTQYTKTFPQEATTVDPNVILPGSHSMRRIFIDEPLGIPSVSEWGYGVTQSLKEGSSISFSVDQDDPDTIVVSAIGGAGSGYHSSANSGELLYINKVSGKGDSGAFSMGTHDCLNKIERPNTIYPNGDLKDSISLPHTIQLLSDCTPCCGCSKYRAVSAAITRRSTRLKQLCDTLSGMIVANAALYNQAVDRINASRKPIARVRNVRVRENNFSFSVQNVCSVPLYAHVAITMTGGTGVTWDNFSIATEDRYMIHDSLAELPPMALTPQDYNYTNPETPNGNYSKFISGSDYASRAKTIPPGGYSDIIFNYNLASLGLGAAVFDLRETHLRLKFETNGIYGSMWTYGCKKDIYEVEVVQSGTTVRKACDGGFVNDINYRVVEVQA